jgi:hypothetical protein
VSGKGSVQTKKGLRNGEIGRGARHFDELLSALSREASSGAPFDFLIVFSLIRFFGFSSEKGWRQFILLTVLPRPA